MARALYPILLKLEDRSVLVIGGGRVASRRVQRLQQAGARVAVVSPEASPEIAALEAAGKLVWSRRRFEPQDLDGRALVFVAAGDPAVAREARARTRGGALLNVADDESLSDFHVPAVAARGRVQLAVSTGGESPGAAARIRGELESWLEANEAFIDEILAAGRTRAAAGEEPRGERPPGPGLTPPPGPASPAAAPRAWRAEPGKVYIVGAGPGDPGLLTLRAAALLESADVVYYDRLVSASILERIPARVEKVYVGKEVGCPARADIEALLARSAREGKRVVRLKGGDPFVFGRGGEEMLELRRAGIEFEVVPGVSALSSVPGWAGIPVTARGVADEIVVRSGHAGAAGDDDEADEPVGSGAASAARARRGSGTTYIYFMAVRRLAHVVEELRREGLPSSTPVAVIQKGTLPEQKVLVSDLGSLLATAEREPPESPALVVAGEVVRFAVLDESQALPESRLLSERR